MKRKLSLLLALVLLLTVFTSACKKDNEPADVPGDDVEDEPGEDVSDKPTEPMGEITIGSTTELTADWSPVWQNNAADYDIYNFINGLGTVDMTFDGVYVINETVVEKYDITENDDGSKTYTWTIKDGLVWDDGTPITAKDYVASVMLWSAPIIADMGAGNTAGYRYTGWSEFSSGESKVFEGVRLIDEKTFAVTISAENLPYFFELPLASVGPERLDYWTDENVEILDDGEGCYFSDNFNEKNEEEEYVYAAKIEEARFNVHHPSSGPYVVESYDEASKTAVLKVNDKYPGNWEGQKPLIETIIYKKVSKETSMDELSTGAVDLLSAMSTGDEIKAGLDLVDKGGYDYVDYPRAGYGKLELICDFGPTQFVEVRQAICHLLDRNDFAKSFTGGFGAVVNGPYGEAMWYYQETKSKINEKIDQYSYSLEDAVALLEKGGWVYDENGNEYPGEGIRYKKTDDGLMPLILEWASTEDNDVSDLLVVKLQENPDVEAAGMKINQTVMSFGELLNWLYRDASQGAEYGVPTFHMFNLGTGFNPEYDLSRTYTTDPDMIAAGYNTNRIIDEKLESLAKEMVLTEPEDKEGFKSKFVDFIVRWNELLPDIPLYSNIYHDFYTDRLKNYDKNDIIRVTDAILYAYVTE